MNYIKIRRMVETQTPLLRKPTKEELKLIKEDEFFELPDDLIDWDKEETTEEDYSYSGVEVIFDNKTLLKKYGKY